MAHSRHSSSDADVGNTTDGHSNGLLIRRISPSSSSSFLKITLTIITLLVPTASKISLPSHFADNAILQTWNKYHFSAKLYGTANPNEIVNATTNITVWPWMSAVADPVDGFWSISYNLPPGTSPGAAFTLTLTGSDDPQNPVVFTGLKWGDVYVCMGDNVVSLPISMVDDGEAWLSNATTQTLLKNKNLMLFAGRTSLSETFLFDWSNDASGNSPCVWNNDPNMPCNQWVVASNASISAFSAICLQTITTLMTQEPHGNPGNSIVGLVQITPITPSSGSTRSSRNNYSSISPLAGIDSFLNPALSQIVNSTCASIGDGGGGNSGSATRSSLYNGMFAPIAEQTLRGLLFSTAGSDLVSMTLSASSSSSSSSSSFPQSGAYACHLSYAMQGLRLQAGIGDYPLLFPSLSPGLTQLIPSSLSSGSVFFDMGQEMRNGLLPHAGAQVVASVGAVTNDVGNSTLSVDSGQWIGYGPSLVPSTLLPIANRLAAAMTYMGFWSFTLSSYGPKAASATIASTSSSSITVYFGYAPDGNITLPHLQLVSSPGCTVCCSGISSIATGMFQIASDSFSSSLWYNTTVTYGNTSLIISAINGNAPSSIEFIRYGAINPLSPECFVVDNTTGLPASPFLLPVTVLSLSAEDSEVQDASGVVIKQKGTLPPASPSVLVSASSRSLRHSSSSLGEKSLPYLHPFTRPCSQHLIQEDGTFNRTEYLIHGRARARAAAEAASTTTSTTSTTTSTTTPIDAKSFYAGSSIISPTPALGYNSWQAARCNIDEVVALATADAMKANGFLDAGYGRVGFDDCVMRSRLPSNMSLVEDETRFPSTLFVLGDALVERGFSLGLYTSQSSSTCVGRPASYMMEDIDTQRWCEWNISLIKVDDCGGAKYANSSTSWTRIRQGLDTHCPQSNVILSVESCGDPKPSGCGGWIRSTGAQMWRTTGDVQLYWSSVLDNLDGNEIMAPIAGPGAINDPDMLIGGHSGVSLAEAKSQVGGWTISAAPLLVSFALNDPQLVTKELTDIFINPEILAVDQDIAVVQGVRVMPSDGKSNATGVECWSRPLAAGGGNVTAVFMINRSEEPADITCQWSAIAPSVLTPTTPATVRDLWAQADIPGTFIGNFTATQVPSHGSWFVTVTPV